MLSPTTVFPSKIVERALVLEQVMRCTDDETALSWFETVEPHTPAAKAALGRLISQSAVPLPAGCPLLAWVMNVEVAPDWRNHVVAAPQSLWGELECLRALYGPAAPEARYAENGYAELRELRLRATSDLS